jgi:serine/threonine protein kinase
VEERVAKQKKVGWRFEKGDEVVPRRYALANLGGGRDYEAYLAWDDELYTLVVIKILRPTVVDNERSLRRIRREAGVLEKLQHPLIVRAFGAVLDGPRPHLRLEYVEGASLSDLLDVGPLEVEQVLPLGLRLCSAIHFMAARDVIHLDIKPSNVILGSQPRLIDFSIARSTERARRATSSIGTDLYMAPEQCDPARLGPLTPAADVWGWGATMWHALSGRVPFRRRKGYDADDPHQRWPQLEGSPRKLPASVPPELGGCLTACLSMSPGARPSPAEVAEIIETLIVDDDVYGEVALDTGAGEV